MIATVTLLFQRLSIAIQRYLRAHNILSTSIRTSSHLPFLLSTLSFSPTLHYTAYNNKVDVLQHTKTCLSRTQGQYWAGRTFPPNTPRPIWPPLISSAATSMGEGCMRD